MRNLPLVCISMFLFCPPALGQWDQPGSPERGVQDLVFALYGERMTQVRRTREMEDDRALRGELLHWSKRVGWVTPNQVAFIVCALSLDTVDPADPGWQVRLGERLRALEPWHPMASDLKFADYYANWFAAASAADKPGVAEARIEALMRASSAMEAAWQIDEASRLLREAERVARDTNSPYEEVLRQEQRRLVTLGRYGQQLEQQQRQLERRDDPAIARAVAIRLAVERHDFENALRYAQMSGDADLLRQIDLAGKDASLLEPADSLMLAQWYTDLAKGEILNFDRARMQACCEARFYAHEFLNRYEKHDVIRLRAEEILGELDGRIALLEPEPLLRPAGAWRELLSAVIPPRANAPGSMVRGQHLRVRNNTLYLHESAAAIPAIVPREYQLRFAASLTHANDRKEMTVYFPIGSRGGRLTLGAGGEKSCQIAGAGTIEAMGHFIFPEDRPIAFLMTVRELDGGQVKLCLQAEGTDVFEWTGSAAALQAAGGQGPPARLGNGFVFDCGTTYEITQLAVRRAAAEKQ